MRESKPTDSVAAVGCFVCIAAVAIFAIVYGKVDVKEWFASWGAHPGRYQVVSGRFHDYSTGYAPSGDLGDKDAPTMVKVDTDTGRTWALVSGIVTMNGAGVKEYNPERWVEIPTYQPTPSPSPSN